MGNILDPNDDIVLNVFIFNSVVLSSRARALVEQINGRFSACHHYARFDIICNCKHSKISNLYKRITYKQIYRYRECA